VVFYLLPAIAIALFFIITSIRVINRIRSLRPLQAAAASSSSDSTPKTSKKSGSSLRKIAQVYSVAIKLILVGVLTLAATGMLFVMGFALPGASPPVVIWVSVFFHVFLNLKTLVTIIILRPPRRGGSPTATGSGSTTSHPSASTRGKEEP
jgi:hypothetical protein